MLSDQWILEDVWNKRYLECFSGSELKKRLLETCFFLQVFFLSFRILQDYLGFLKTVYFLLCCHGDNAKKWQLKKLHLVGAGANLFSMDDVTLAPVVLCSITLEVSALY